MKITNKTNYDTKHLKAFFTHIATAELDPAERKAAKFLVGYTRSKWPMCRGTRDGALLLDVPRTDRTGRLKPALGVVFAWAMMTWLRKVRMTDWRKSPRYSFHGSWLDFYAHLNAYPLEQKIPPPVKKRSPAFRVSVRLRHALDQVKRWERKRKLAETKIAVWNATVKYHQRRAKAMTVPVDPAKSKPVRKPKPALEETLRQARQSLLRKRHEDTV